MDNATIQAITVIIFLAVLVVNAVVRRDNRPQRRISAMEKLPLMVSRSIEMNRPLHMAFGGFNLGDQDTLLALAAGDAFYPLAREATLGDAAPIVTVGTTTTLQLARDMLRRAHRNSNMHNQSRPYWVRWYPDSGFAMVAAFSAIMADDRLSGQVLAGNNGAELALPLYGAQLRSLPTIVASTRPAGQAVAYALADDVLIGEELFAVPGYLDTASSLRVRSLVLDVVRFITVLGLIVVFAASLLGRV